VIDVFERGQSVIGRYKQYARGRSRANAYRELGSDTTLMVHPSTITGPVGGIAAGVDWEAYEKDGTLQIDPKKALVGAMAGGASEVAWRQGRALADAIATKWDEKLASPFMYIGLRGGPTELTSRI
jgi:hypothetical protein